MKNLEIFNYGEKTVRTVNLNGEIWWVLKDVCEVLELSNPSRVAERLDDDEVKKIDPNSELGLGNPGNVPINIINESGLYEVILRSDKPEAKKFKHWITHEVLPTIRKHGVYAKDELLENPDLFIEALQNLKAEKAKTKELQATVSIQEQQISELRPKASYYDLILNCRDAVAASTIAKDYGKSAYWLNERLHELGIQFKQGDIWLLYQKHAGNGYTCTKTHNYPAENGEIHSKVHTYWTQKGRIFIYDLLKDNGDLPLIEKKGGN
jgi:prophage antirepressor-like protein